MVCHCGKVKAGQDGEERAWRVACTRRELVLQTSMWRRDIHLALGARALEIRSLVVSLRSTLVSEKEPLRSIMLVTEHETWQKHFAYHFGSRLQLIQF